MNKRANRPPVPRGPKMATTTGASSPTPPQLAPLKLLLLILFYDLMAHFRKTYCWPTRATMRKMIHKRNGRRYSLSWIDHCLFWLRESGYIVSYVRPGRRADGTLFNRPSNRQITFKGLQFLRKNGWNVVSWLWNWGKKKVGIKDTTQAAESWSRTTAPGSPPRRLGNPFLV